MIETMVREFEIWKKVSLLPGMSHIDDRYLISNQGRLKGIRGRISNTRPDKYGYIRPGLTTKEGKLKKISLHRLVALAFCEGYQEGLHVNHRDEVKHNNHFENLEWITQAENNAHGTRGKRIGEANSQPVEAITDSVIFTFKSIAHVVEFGFSYGAVSEACRGIYNSRGKLGGTNKYKGFLWRYA